MTDRIGNHLVTGLCVGLDRNLVGLRARRDEQRGFLAKERGDALLQGIDGGVFGHHVVTHLGAQHRLPHGRRRPRHGVTAHIDQAFTHEASRASSATTSAITAMPFSIVSSLTE